MASALVCRQSAALGSAQSFRQRRSVPSPNDECCNTFSLPKVRTPCSRPGRLMRTMARAAQDDAPVSSESAAADKRRADYWEAKNADPIANKGDFIWNVKWRERLDLEEQMRKAEEERKNKEEEGTYGFLSLSRPLMLDSVDIDLTEELQRAASKRHVEQEAAAETAERTRYRAAPTRKEMKAWAKAGKNATGLQRQLLEDAKKAQIIRKLDRREERLRYEKLKEELQVFTLVIGLFCLGGTYVKYDMDTAISYAGGLIGALVYLRMLSSSVDNLGQSGGKAAARSALGQPRLLVPVVMVMAFNRWNALAAPNTGVELHLIPMLVGFFTYKLSTLLQTFRELVPSKGAPSDSS
ncbi:hypothetical protein KFL_001540120 [Klebsormidium nitens]|uniref:CGL160/ATPI domain-containing protein n=1 Tax=Klebsormidium nitens TaxID=105231 RepID=A0A1Y1HY57_KLENI|nr:hypothetical protein KFL_001540120 [Klebsormidium nitens]|eukprot:GAQ83594.1 hypothetical protein KFL_001540120 [Klebsormidium nitens]